MVAYLKSDLEFILEQILIAEAHAAATNAGTPIEVSRQILLDLLPNSTIPWGLRTVDGSLNNLVPGQENFGAANQQFPHLVDPVYRNDADGDTFDLNGGAPGGLITNTNYANSGNVADADPRIISNLIVDQTDRNPAAVAANDGAPTAVSPGLDGIFGTDDDRDVFFIPNATPDEGLSAPFNSWMTLFGQFFDHGLDLVNKGGSGTIFIPLQTDDPLYNPATPQLNFMVLTRASVNAGTDGVLGTADDVALPTNDTSPFVDQNQTYTSHPSHQVFLRAYEMRLVDADGIPGGPLANKPFATGALIEGADGGMANWGEVKAQAATLLGILLDDRDAIDLPLLATDQYGNFIPGANGFPQLVTLGGLVEGNPLAPVDASLAVRTGHMFLADIAHSANPFNSQTGAPLTEDAGDVIGGPPPAAGFYDDELLDAHFIAGDGRANENIGLTAVHHVFHSEHNRLVEHTKDVILASNDLDFLNQWLATDVAALPANQAQIDALAWDGERLFQAAKFGTEMQYQHLVFEEFARKVQPNVDFFISYNTTIDPSIVAEFAHAVYRFGHSMLTETIDRFDPTFTPDHIGLIAGFLNPLEFTASGPTPEEAAGAIVRGMTRQVGNEIDEFVTEALRNNLLGLPLDLAAINIARGRDTGVPTLNAARREFFDGTGDTQLKPYTSWVDFAMNVKNPLSVINFIAAYGTHDLILAATNAAEKRAAAELLVLGGAGEPADRFDFLNSTGDYANQANGVTITGVDAIDLWIGGLAEKQMPFGGLLGSTFNFVFETQMEALQDGDRFYYLARTAGLNFFTQLEQNSFAGMIMRNTDATHLPGDVFSTPAYILEVDADVQYTGLGVDGRDDPTGDNPFFPLVQRSADFLRYNGEDHVVLGGSANNDTLIAGIGDDTLWGDGGDDRLEGGDGADQILGGDGDDILTDLGGDDLIQGGDGNDVINGGNGINLLLGGFGSDFIMAGEDLSEIFGGAGNDFLFGSPNTELVVGNEGDDWIETGTADGSPGDNFDGLGLDEVAGNDVFFGSGGIDEFVGEGGDDIMVGGPGADRMEGFSGFDWVTYKDDAFGVTVDLTLEAFDEAPIPPSNAAVMDRFGQMEGLSGSNQSDILRGDDADALEIANAGAKGSVLTNIALITGLQELLGLGVTSFGSGNIILGGGGSDIIEGRAGNDIIDGDALLNVRISIRDEDGNEIGTANSMVGPVSSTAVPEWNGQQLSALMLAGEINPAQLQIVREILDTGNPDDVDTAVFSGAQASYFISDADEDGRYTIIDNVGTDGVDIVRNVERLQFSDGIVTLIPNDNEGPEGELTIDNTAPLEDQLLTVSALGVIDPDNPSGGAITGPISYVWEVEQDLNSGVFIPIIRPGFGGADIEATGTTFLPGDEEVGLRLRVRAIYQDVNGVIETVLSAPTDAVINVNDAPTGVPIISDPTPQEGLALAAATGSIVDLDGLDGVVFAFQWQMLTGTDPLNPADWTDIADATTALFTPLVEQIGFQLRVQVSYTDDQGSNETVFSAPTAAVENVNDAAFGAPVISDTSPTEGREIIAATDEIVDLDGLEDAVFAFQWQVLTGTDPLDPADWSDIAGATSAQFTPLQGQVGLQLRVQVSFTDDQGTLETVFSDPTTIVGDEITLNGGAQTLTATEGDDVVFAGTGNDNISGAGGNDELFGQQNSDLLSGGAGDDLLVGGTGGDTLNGDADNDILFGDNGEDTLNGGAGDDILTGGNGNDTVNGNAGNDTILFTIGDETDTVNGGADTDTLEIRGTLGANTLNVVSVGAVLTQFQGGGVSNVELVTADLLAGTDTLSYAGNTAANGVTVDLALGTATGFSSIANVENVTGGSGADTLTGDGNANALNGGAGVDTLNGGGGVDTLNGGTGADVLIGGLGADTINTGATNDNVQDVVRFAAVGDYGDTINSFDANNGAATDDRIEFRGALNTLFDDIGNNDTFQFASGNGANNGNTLVNLNTTTEALFLSGNNGEGVTTANLGNATSVANEFNSEFNLTNTANGETTLLVINDTLGNSAALWQWTQAGGLEISAAELTLIAIVNANATVTTDNFGLGV